MLTDEMQNDFELSVNIGVHRWLLILFYLCKSVAHPWLLFLLEILRLRRQL